MDPRDLIFNTIGGLALFLYGMGLVSDGLKLAAGDRLRTMLGRITKWRVMALLMGTGVTCLVQSSSATTVMVVGLINAGMLTLQQAIAVILGANIGTTITGWLVAVVAGMKQWKISNFALPFIAVGLVMQLVGRRQKIKNYGGVVLGLGLLFLGLSIVSDGLGVLKSKEHSPIIDVLRIIGDRPILAVLAGAFFTMIVQSSSASIAMVILLAGGGAFGTDPAEALRIAIPFILGDNIGTTVTAQLAALRANLAGKRAAMAHTVFNIVGVVLIMPFVYFGAYSAFVRWLVPHLNLGMQIAFAHTAFNVIAALAVLPFVGFLEKLVIRILPARRRDRELQPITMEEHLLDTPALAIAQAMREMVRMCRTARNALEHAATAIVDDDYGALARVRREEDAVDDFQTRITHYLVGLSQRRMDARTANELPVLLHTVNDIERVSDHATNIAELAERKIEQKLAFSEPGLAEIARMRMDVSHMFDNVQMAIETSDPALAKRALTYEDSINAMQLEFRASHVERLTTGGCEPRSGLIFIDFINNMEKIGDHLANVAQAVLGDLQWGEGAASVPDGEEGDPLEDQGPAVEDGEPRRPFVQPGEQSTEESHQDRPT